MVLSWVASRAGSTGSALPVSAATLDRVAPSPSSWETPVSTEVPDPVCGACVVDGLADWVDAVEVRRRRCWMGHPEEVGWRQK